MICSQERTVQTVRAKFTIVALVLSLIAMAAGPAFAARTHGCGAGEHDCCKGAKLAPCCSTDEHGGAPSSSTATPRIDIGGAATALAVLPWLAPDLVLSAPRLLAGSPRSPGTDLTTLFGSLRI
jgi:hypothetical protein